MLSKDDILKIPRRNVRYQLYRIRTQEEGGPSHTAKTIKEYYEKQNNFTCWSDFARRWDVDKEGKHNRIVTRKFTELQEWNRQLTELVEELPWRPK
jgi:hypothetical protein